jgi:hyaluronan synthase
MVPETHSDDAWSARAGIARARDDELVDRSRRRRGVEAVAMFGLVVITLALLVMYAGVGLSVYGAVTLTYLAVKLGLAIRYRPSRDDPAAVGSIAAVVPFYNEDPVALEACLRSILDQSRPVDSIYVVDDGSDDTWCFHLTRRLLAVSGHPNAVVHRLDANVGKRHAQAWAFRRLRDDLVVTVDSDTVLHPHAVHEALRGFADSSVQAVTGNVQAYNAATNLLTRLTSLRYVNAFLWERAAYSVLGSVLCACGSFSVWRRSLIDDHLDDYLRQSFMGVPVTYGDDRRLTNYALRRGRVLLQDTAVAYTTVPERFRHYANQQLRWNKSFFRETLWALRVFRPWTWTWLLSFSELALWVCFTFVAAAAFVVVPLLTGTWPSPWYLVFVAMMAYARSVRYLGSQRTPLRSQVAVYLLAPVYGLLYITVLMPIRLWALCNLRNPGWGTRRQVEVRWPVPADADERADAPMRKAS